MVDLKPDYLLNLQFPLVVMDDFVRDKLTEWGLRELIETFKGKVLRSQWQVLQIRATQSYFTYTGKTLWIYYGTDKNTGIRGM